MTMSVTISLFDATSVQRTFFVQLVCGYRKALEQRPAHGNQASALRRTHDVSIGMLMHSANMRMPATKVTAVLKTLRIRGTQACLAENTHN
jgi:hypothetical protein